MNLPFKFSVNLGILATATTPRSGDRTTRICRRHAIAPTLL
ncbi:hypothetical protein QUA83_03760 [Microcoleus sp. K1-B1]